MGRKTDELRWTPEGTAELARDRDRAFPRIVRTEAALDKRVKTVCAEYAKACERGVKHARDEGTKHHTALAVTYLKGWKPGQAMSADRCALIATALGAKATDEDISPWLDVVVERGGAEMAVDTLEEMWRLSSDHDSGRGIRITGVDVDTTTAHDASCSYGKGDIVQYLRSVGRERPELRTRLAARVAKRWKHASAPARSAMAVALEDAKLAAAMVTELQALEKKSNVYAHWSWGWLPHVVDDLAVVKKLYKKLQIWPGLLDLERFGGKAVDLFAPLVTGRTEGHMRERMLVELSNVHGPKTARLMALYVTNKPHKATTTAYLKKYPELLKDVLADPKCSEDHPYLEPLLTET